jgi:16S rRNA (uracil1498-N3)-methyltransferase
MSERFYLAERIDGRSAVLQGEEARHLAAVMRARPGDRVVLFDGHGLEFTAEIAAIGKHSVALEIVERREIDRELAFELTLAVALPKGERQKWLVEKLTELGVTRLIPLSTERGVAQPTDAALDRLRRTVIEASKQCGRNRLLEVASPVTAKDLFAAPTRGTVRLVADSQGAALKSVVAPGVPCVATIGPEGGFAPGELQLAAERGWTAVSLGPRILRVETAAIGLAACLVLH